MADARFIQFYPVEDFETDVTKGSIAATRAA